MTSLSAIQAQCKQVDQEIKARQEEFGIGLYELLEDYDNNGLEGDAVSPATFLSCFTEQWGQVREDIDAHAQKQQGQNATKKKRRRWSKADQTDFHGDIFVEQWILQRKQRFGVESFDTAFEVLGTAAGSITISTLSPQERKLNALVQDAVEDVLQLERLKESYARDVQVTVHDSGVFLSLCGVSCC
jgi:hypothetical protein